jgi:hypothetical protein
LFEKKKSQFILFIHFDFFSNFFKRLLFNTSSKNTPHNTLEKKKLYFSIMKFSLLSFLLLLLIHQVTSDNTNNDEVTTTGEDVEPDNNTQQQPNNNNNDDNIEIHASSSTTTNDVTTAPTAKFKTCDEIHIKWACDRRADEGCTWLKGGCGYKQTQSPGSPPIDPCPAITSQLKCALKAKKCMWNPTTKKCVKLVITPSPTLAPTHKIFPCSRFTTAYTCCGKKYLQGIGPCENDNSKAGCLWARGKCLEHPSKAPTRGPNLAPTKSIVEARNASLVAWQWFFDLTSGEEWTKCRNLRNAPCLCQTILEKRPISVTCDDKGVITAIEMRANHLKSDYFPEGPILALFNAGLKSLDIARNIKLKYEGCAHLPPCFKRGNTCDISPVTLCVEDAGDGSSGSTPKPTTPTITTTLTPNNGETGSGTNIPSRSPSISQVVSGAGTRSPTKAGDAGWECSTMNDCNQGFCKGGHCCAVKGWPYTCISCDSTGVCNGCDSDSYLQDGTCFLKSPTFRPTNTLTPTANANDLRPEVLDAWKIFYDSTDGGNWFRCSSNRNTPCDCNTVLVNRPIQVTCAHGTITSIIMPANRLKAAYFPEGVLGTLFDLGLNHLEINNNELLKNNGYCVNLPQCSNRGVFCAISPSWLCAV